MLRQARAAGAREIERERGQNENTCRHVCALSFDTSALHILIHNNNNPQVRMHKCTAGDDADDYDAAGDDDDGCACKFSVCESKM